MSKVVLTTSQAFAPAGLSAADLEALRDVNDKIALARTDPSKIADNAWACICTVY